MRARLLSRPLRLVAVGLAVLVVAFVALQVAAAGRMAPGTSVAGLSLSWSPKKAAAASLRADLARRDVLTARFETSSGDVVLTLDQLGVTIDVEATIAAAYRTGRGGVSALRLLVGPGAAVSPVVRVDAARFRSGLAALRAEVDKPARDAALKLVSGKLTVAAGRDGIGIDEIALQRAVLARLTALRPFAGPVPTQPVTPRVTTVAAQDMAGVARAYMARPLTLRYRATTMQLSPAEMARMLAINTGADAAERPLTFDNPAAVHELHRLFARIERPPVEAQVKIVGTSVEVSQSSDGFMIDMPALVSDLDAAASGAGLRDVFVAMTPVSPKLSTDDVRELGLSALGSQFITYFDPANKARANNLTAAARLVDGRLVKPGEVFSLNAAMGPRTLNRGFDYAPVIASDGVLRPGVGGGICQYATTLFNAVFFAGLPIVERRAHSLYIDHYPIGRDATVSWGSVDFKFRNDTDKTLMIRSWTAGGALTVVIVGATGRTVDYTTSPFYDIHKPATSRTHPRVVYDNTLASGLTRWEQGVTGRSVKVVRTVHSGDKVLFSDTFVSVYDPQDWIKRIGTR